MQEVLPYLKETQEEMECVDQAHRHKVLEVVEELPLQVEMDLQALVVMEEQVLQIQF